jgi:hypothetical protein
MMPERIRELAEQASKDNSDGYPVTLEYSNRFAEKFLELIVKECAGISESDAVGDDPACCTNTADRIARQIKKHFGVEA